MNHKTEIEALTRDLKYVKARLRGLQGRCGQSHDKEDQILEGILDISVKEVDDVIDVLERTRDELQ